MKTKLVRYSLLPLIWGLLLLTQAGTVWAAPPPNDDFPNATVIASLPFTTTQDTSEATFAPDDPFDCTNNGSVWFAFTPATNMTLVASTSGSSFDTVLSAYIGSQGALALVPGACNNDFNSFTSRITFPATAGTTYYFLVGYCCGFFGNGGGPLQFTVEELIPPANDNFSTAASIPGIPYIAEVDTSLASVEVSEPSPSCSFGNFETSVWFSFAPSATQSLTAYNSSFLFSTVLAVYSGTSLSNLTEVGCNNFSGPVTFNGAAGQTYYFQLGGLFGSRGSSTFQVVQTPPITAVLNYSPTDPSRFDNVQFFDSSFDPVFANRTQVWNFGDGSPTATGCCPQHRFPADGDYNVTLAITTSDGRTASTTQTVQVRTYDVGISRVTVPTSARVGQTRQISVGIRNTTYPVVVDVLLYKSNPAFPFGGWEQIGVLRQEVPVRSGNRTTDFNFSYTFTAADGDIGKVNFRAVAILPNARDGIPTDNEFISLATRVNK